MNMIDVFLHRVIIGLFPCFVLILKIGLGEQPLRLNFLNKKLFALTIIGILLTSTFVLLENNRVTVTFTIPNIITWGIIPLTNWLIMGISYLYFYSKQFFLLDTLFLTSATLRVMGETHEIPIALIKGYFLNSLVTGLIYIPFLILYAKHSEWKRTKLFIPFLLLMLSILFISPYIYFTEINMTIFSYLSRFSTGLFYLEFARGFAHG